MEKVPQVVTLMCVSIILSTPCGYHHHKATLWAEPSINTWQSGFIDRQPMRALLLGRASAALGQSATRNRTRASELCGDAVTWRWEKECQHGPVARTRCECATAITRRGREENTNVHIANRRRCFPPPSLLRTAHGRSSQMSGILLLGSSGGDEGGGGGV